MPPSTPWPSLGDYTAAIQNPRNCFTDPELTRGQVSTTRLGLPAAASGQFAVVYQMRSGARTLAVRCFSHVVTDQQQRYDVLSQHLRRFWHPALVEFAYLAQGIRVRGPWYPVVRMEWSTGKQMHQYIEDNLRQGPVLERLAAQWRGVAAGLRGADMAHGDLQHGNILVDPQGQMRLVDYDGWFLPALSGRPPGEVGHPNYQHPERLHQGYYAANADAFSVLVIYVSILALRAEPGLWTFHTGENLLCKADDFTRPGQTSVWQRLHGSSDPEVRRLATTLVGVCRGPVAAVPDLETVLQGVTAGAVPPPPVVPTPALQPGVAPAPQARVTCPTCGLRNAATEVYCQRCIHQLCGDRGCPHCQAPAPARAPYCPQCGKSPVGQGPVAPAALTCPACGLGNEATEIYCQRCTYQLCSDRKCPHCQGQAPVGTPYCPQCGKRL